MKWRAHHRWNHSRASRCVSEFARSREYYCVHSILSIIIHFADNQRYIQTLPHNMNIAVSLVSAVAAIAATKTVFMAKKQFQNVGETHDFFWSFEFFLFRFFSLSTCFILFWVLVFSTSCFFLHWPNQRQKTFQLIPDACECECVCVCVHSFIRMHVLKSY